MEEQQAVAKAIKKYLREDKKELDQIGSSWHFTRTNEDVESSAIWTKIDSHLTPPQSGDDYIMELLHERELEESLLQESSTAYQTQQQEPDQQTILTSFKHFICNLQNTEDKNQIFAFHEWEDTLLESKLE